MLSRRHKSHLP